MEMNRKELKKITYSFNSVASRMMRVSFEEYNIVLKKFLAFINSSDIIMEYIRMGEGDFVYDGVEDDWENLINGEGDVFDFGPSAEEESNQIYILLQYILENVSDPYNDFCDIYGQRNVQDGVKEFNDRVVMVLINHIGDYLTKVGIDMGLDENVVWNVSGGQVNVASGDATINATQNNGISPGELDDLVRSIREGVSGVEKEDAESILDTVELAEEELKKPEPKISRLKNCVKSINSMLLVLNGLPELSSNMGELVRHISTYIK